MRPRNDLASLDPTFRELLQGALTEAAELDPIVIETWRSQARQDELYARGRTTPGTKVTWALSSKHQFGLAADVCPRRNGQIDWTWKEGFDKWGVIAERHGLIWGGRFENYDGAHVQAPWA